jgi:hypothetical protein
LHSATNSWWWQHGKINRQQLTTPVMPPKLSLPDKPVRVNDDDLAESRAALALSDPPDSDAAPSQRARIKASFVTVSPAVV